MSATYQTQTLDTSQIEVPAHPSLEDVEALHMVLQIANPTANATEGDAPSGDGWNLNKLLRYIRCQRKNQQVEAGLTSAAAPDAEDDMVVADANPAQTLLNLKAFVAGLVTDATSNGVASGGHGDHGVTQSAEFTSASTRGDWAESIADTTQGTDSAGKANVDAQCDAGKAYDLIDACALAIAFAWSKGGGEIGDSATRTAVFERAKDFRAQISDNQIKYDLDRFGTDDGANTRSKLLASLENQKIDTDANANLVAGDFHDNNNEHKTLKKSQGAAWLSMLGARIVAHSLREDFNEMNQRRMVVFGGSDAGAPGLDATDAASDAPNSKTDGADPFVLNPAVGASRYIDSSNDAGVADSDLVVFKPITGPTPGTPIDQISAAYETDETRYMPGLHAKDNICLAFKFRVTNSQASGSTAAREAKVGFVFTQSTAGSLEVVAADGKGKFTAD